MKTLLTFFVLFFSSSVFSDEISDFQIEGMSIGDSLLQHFTKKEINSFEKLYSNFNDKKFYTLVQSLNNNKYDLFRFRLKENDNKFIIYNIVGEKNFFKLKINECKKTKNNVVNEISSLFVDIKPFSYEYVYDYMDDGTSIAYITDFQLDDGAIRIWCRDWSEITEKNQNFQDDFVINITSKEFTEWNNKNK